MVTTLNDESLAAAVQELIEIDEHLRAVYLRYGNPPLWAREHSFKTLLHIILAAGIACLCQSDARQTHCAVRG